MKKHETSKVRNQKGFTLIELSIVLVIIGLIVGGVLVGQDLIHAAQIRATVSQIEKYNAAANTFHSKYNGLPGDLPNGANFFPAVANAGTAGAMVAGNSLIEPYTAGALDGESELFWYMLEAAGLTADLVTEADYQDDCANVNTDACTPAAKMGEGNRFEIVGVLTHNYFMLGKFAGDASAVTALADSAGLTPTEAYQIDTKLDDGNAATGTVLSINGLAAPNAAAAALAGCYRPADGTYGINSSANKVACILGIRTAF